MWQLLNNLHLVIRCSHQSRKSGASPAVERLLSSGILTDLCICRQLSAEAKKHLISYFAPSCEYQESTCLLITIFHPNK